MSATWKFRIRGRGEVNHDPVEGEFFTPDGLSGSLVREAIQNSLDAKIDGSDEPVQVRFALSKSQPSESLHASLSEPYVRELSPHLDAFSNSSFPRLATDPLDFLVIEDFGTRGLNGDPRQESDEDDLTAPKNDFYYFWRNVGRSRKGETDRGRWGLGKTVFPASSRINSFFGLTVRRDGRRLLMGESVLKIHKTVGGGTGRHDPYGFFGAFDHDLPLPLEDAPFIQKFSEDFRLTRTNQTGLSIVVPFPRRDEINISEIVRSAIVHYFYPILAGGLIVRVEGDGTNLVLDSASIETVTRDLEWVGSGNNRDKLLHLFDLSRWAISRGEDDFVTLRSPQLNAVPKWEESVVPPDTLSVLRQRYDAGERMALRVPITVERKNQAVQQSHFSVYLMRDSQIDKGEDHYIRQGITVSKINMLQNKGARGLVVINERALTTLLGDAENPAHTDWQERATRIRENYVSGASRVRFVKNSLRFIVDLLTQRTAGRDEDLLKDLFYVEVPPDEPASPRPKRKKQKGESNDETPDVPDARIRAFAVQKIAGGFCVTGNSEATVDIGGVRIEVAYEVRSGNAFRQYDLFDFELNRPPFRISADGASCEAGRNCLQVTVQRKDFTLEVKGFDPKRDIRIKTVVERNAG